MNENRSVFALDGVTGMLIATVLLLGILVFLTINALAVQNREAANFYKIENESAIQMRSVDNVKHVVDVK